MLISKTFQTHISQTKQHDNEKNFISDSIADFAIA